MNRNCRAKACLFAIACGFAVATTAPAAEPISPEELAAVRAAEQARIDVVEKVYGAVVCIYGNNRQGGGSGVVFDPAGYALTNHHVVAGAGTSGWGGLSDGKLYRWKLIGTDPGGDIAIIQLTGRDSFIAAPLGNSDTVRPGDFVLAMGNPFVLAEDQRATVTLGVVSGIERFQRGSGSTGNVLVYGNCIQVDTSINPGNSGGPLFNMRGEVIGINGRISLLERGRVNVGVGYAVSMEQIKNFIPDILATKVAQHGTLDATFSNRADGLVCEAINLDSPASRAGLELGDVLLEFDHRPMRDANEFTNIISTLPTGWPVHLAVEHDDGERDDLWVRLTPLPYGAQPQRQPQPQPRPQPRPRQQPNGNGDKPSRAPKPDDNERPAEAKKPGQPDQPPPVIVRAPGISMENPNTIRDAKLNAESRDLVLNRWRERIGAAGWKSEVAAFRITDEVLGGNEQLGEVETIVATDGAFRVKRDISGEQSEISFAGGAFTRSGPDGEESLDADLALRDPTVVQAALLASIFSEAPLSVFGEVQLDGSDKAAGLRAYRLRVGSKESPLLFAWFSLLDAAGAPEVQLLKAGRGTDASSTRPAVLFDDWQSVAELQLPFRRTVATGLEERPKLQFVAQKCEPLTESPLGSKTP